jgi:hypothetical protein
MPWYYLVDSILDRSHDPFQGCYGLKYLENYGSTLRISGSVAAPAVVLTRPLTYGGGTLWLNTDAGGSGSRGRVRHFTLSLTVIDYHSLKVYIVTCCHCCHYLSK